ncbi:MAG: alpha/beta hydrolase, partial [Candidatus Omnitrophota bacterium]|nr:alpha/beta hydrolase [Candidatus Omnitrophota bacterium]
MMLSLKGLSQVSALIIILVLFVIYLRYIERRSIFFPAGEIEYVPGDIGLLSEDIFFKTPDNLVLNGWFVPTKDATYTILFCHGNAGNISHRMEKLKFF